LNCDIVDAMSTENELMLKLAGILFEPFDADPADVPDDELDEHAAATRLTAAARPTQPAARNRRDVPWPCEREG
jgi:hypothetical protein